MSKNLYRAWTNRNETVHYNQLFILSGTTQQGAVSGSSDLVLTRYATGSFNLAVSGSLSSWQFVTAQVLPATPADLPLRATVSGSLVAGSGSYCTVLLTTVSGSNTVKAGVTLVDSAGHVPGGDAKSLLSVHVIGRISRAG